MGNIHTYKVGDKVRVMKPSRECSINGEPVGDGYGELYHKAIAWQEEGTPLIVTEAGDIDVHIAGLNYFLHEQIEPWDHGIHKVYVLLSTYKDDELLSDEDKEVIKFYVKNNTTIELNKEAVV